MRALTDWRTHLNHILPAAVAVALMVLAPGHALAGKFKVLYSFCAVQGCHDGEIPAAPLLMDSADNLFGTTTQGGTALGTAFELKRTDKGNYRYRVIWNFNGSPTSGMIIDSAGRLYGEAKNILFYKLTFGLHKHKWQATTLQVSCPQGNCGSDPFGGLTYAGQSTGLPYDGTSPLYGVTGGGGANGAGTVFELVPNGNQWTETVLYSFCSEGGGECTDGRQPSGGVVLDNSGNLFGLTFEGGNEFQGVGAGILYELSPNGNSWSETPLYRFCAIQGCADGALAFGNVATDAAGALYGVTAAGGGKCKANAWGCGVVFKVVPNGAQLQEATLYAFCAKRDCRDGRAPQAGLLIDSAGNLFGTTYFGGGNDIDADGLGGGVAFEISGSAYQVLHSFCSFANCADGEYPSAALIMDLSGNLFGTAPVGGAFGNGTQGGAVFELKH